MRVQKRSLIRWPLVLVLVLAACVTSPSEPAPGGGGGAGNGTGTGGSTGSGTSGTGSSGGGSTGTGTTPSTPTGFFGQWTATNSGTPVTLQIWGSEAQPQAAITVGTGPRESLRVMGIASGPPQALYMYRGQDDAMFSLVRLGQNQWLLEAWEDGCSRELPISSWTGVVSNTSAGVNIASTPGGAFNGNYTVAGLAFSMSVSIGGGSRIATGNFGLGNETLVVLGQAAGPPLALYLWRPQDHATISIQQASSGRLVSYWETGCARTGIAR
jgi:hypothetical protein